MGVYEKKGVCRPCCGYDSSCLDFIGEGVDGLVSICSVFDALFPGATPRDAVYAAFEFPLWYTCDSTDAIDQQIDREWQQMRAEYRQGTGRQYPPLYRVHIRIEAEPLSDEEAKTYWERDDSGGGR